MKAMTQYMQPKTTAGNRPANLHDTKQAVLYLRVSDPSQVHTDYDSEGLSIAAQRTACQHKAEQLGLAIIDEYIEPGRSARSIDKRPAFQAMMKRIREQHDIDTVIVYELSRMNRNRYDDAIVMTELRNQHIGLVSVREPIDDTIEGDMMHGIIATINEYRSRKDGADIAYKMKEKIKRGGFTGPAPLGYLNTIDTTPEGYRVKTITPDPERAEHITWAFTQYATGEWSLRRLAHALNARGLTTRPTPKRPARPISTKLIGEILHKRFYIGDVVYKGEIYPAGRHQPLTDLTTYEKCQTILAAHLTSGERSQKYWHYLTGSLRCARCGAPLVYNIIKGNGGQYEYFTCNNRLAGKGCDLPYLPLEQVEKTIEELWKQDQLPPNIIETIRHNLLSQLDTINAEHKTEAILLNKRISDIQAERLKWSENTINNVIPADIASLKQAELAKQLATAKKRLKEISTDDQGTKIAINQALDLLGSSASGYIAAGPQLRRAYNQTWYQTILIDDDATATHVSQAVRSDDLTPLCHYVETITHQTGTLLNPDDTNRQGTGANEIPAANPNDPVRDLFHAKTDQTGHPRTQDQGNADPTGPDADDTITPYRNNKKRQTDWPGVSHAFSSNNEPMVDSMGHYPNTPRTTEMPCRRGFDCFGSVHGLGRG